MAGSIILTLEWALPYSTQPGFGRICQNMFYKFLSKCVSIFDIIGKTLIMEMAAESLTGIMVTNKEADSKVANKNDRQIQLMFVPICNCIQNPGQKLKLIPGTFENTIELVHILVGIYFMPPKGTR